MLIFLLFSLVNTDDIVLIIVEYEELWIKAYRIEEDFGTTESAEALLRQSVQACPSSEALWLLLIQLKYSKQKDSHGARVVVEEAMTANQSNKQFVSSEKIWLTAYQVVIL